MKEMVELRDKIYDLFTLDEVKSICFTLQIDYDDLSREGKKGKIESLIQYLENRKQISELLDLCLQERPNANWQIESYPVKETKTNFIVDKLGLNLAPNLTADYEVVIQQYLRSLINEYNIFRIVSNEGRQHNSDKIYIPQKLTTYVGEESDARGAGDGEKTNPYSEGSGNQPEKIITIDDLITARFGKHAIIFGESGSGKSTLMRQLVITCVENLKSTESVEFGGQSLGGIKSKHPLLPVSINCRSIKNSSLRVARLIEYATEMMVDSQKGKMQHIIQNAIDNGTALFLVDGLDELNNSQIYGALENSIDALPNISVLITTKNSGYKKQTYLKFKHFYLNNFSTIEQKAFLKKFYALDGVNGEDSKIDEFLALIQGENLFENPLSLLITCEGGGLPKRLKNKRDLVASIFNSSFDRYSIRAEIRSSNLMREKERIYKGLGILAIERNKSGYEWLEYDAIYTSMSTQLPENENADDLLDTLSQSFSFFMHRTKSETNAKFKFKHLIFESYFAANYIEMISTDLPSDVFSLFTEPEQEVAYNHKWIEVIRFVLSGKKLSGQEIEKIADYIVPAAQQDARFLDLAVEIVTENSKSLRRDVMIETIKLFIEACKTEMSLKREYHLENIPILYSHFLSFINLDTHDLLIQYIVAAYDNCPDVTIFNLGRLAELYDKQRRKITGATKPNWDEIIDIIKNRLEERVIHVTTMESLPYKADDFPNNKLIQIIDALVASLASSSSTVAARTLSRIFDKKENQEVLSKHNLQLILKSLTDEDCHPYTRHGLINCVRKLSSSQFSEDLLHNQNLMDLMIDELDSNYELNPVVAALALHEFQFKSSRINERLIKGLVSKDFPNHSELFNAIIKNWYRENSNQFFEQVTLNEDPELRDYSLSLLSKQFPDGITKGIIEKIKKLDYPLAHKVIELVENNVEFFVSHPHKKNILICIYLQGQVFLPHLSKSTSSKFQKGYVYVAVHLNEFHKMMVDLRETGLINIKNYNSTVLARFPGEPSDDVLTFMRRKFGFSNFTVVVQKESDQSFDTEDLYEQKPKIVDEILEYKLPRLKFSHSNNEVDIPNEDDENDIPIHSIDFMRIGSGYIHPVEDKNISKERLQMLFAYANHINRAFLPGDNEIIQLEDIDKESTLINGETYEDSIEKIVVFVLIKGTRLSDNNSGYCYLRLTISKLNKLLKDICQVGYFNPNNYDAILLDNGKGNPTEEVIGYMSKTLGLFKDEIVIHHSERISPINDIFEETHKVTEWFFSTNPFNFPKSLSKIEDYYSKDGDETSLHSISSIKIGGGYIHEEKTMDIYESRVKIFSTYVRHTNNYFGDNEKFKLVFAKDPLDKNTNSTNRKEDKDNVVDFIKTQELDQRYSKVVARRGIEKREFKQYEAAIADFDKAIELNYEDAWVFGERGLSKRLLGQHEAAIADFDKAIELDNEYVWAFAQRGFSKRLLEQHEAAIEDFDKAVELNNKYAWAFAQRGFSKRLLEQHEAAIADFDKAIELNYEDAWVFGERGLARQSLEQYETAIEDFDKAVELNNKYAWAFAQRGFSKRLLEQHEAAIADFDKAIELDDKYAGAFAQRGLSKRLLEQHEAAIADFDKAVELDANLRWVYLERCIINRFLGNVDQALLDIEKSIELNSNSDWTYYQQGLVYKMLGREEQFIKAIEMAIQVADEQINNSKDDHEFWRLQLNLALYHLISGNEAKAAEIYRKAIAQSPPQTLANGINDLPLYLKEFPDDLVVLNTYKELESVIKKP